MPLKDKDAYNAYMREYTLKRYHRRRAKAIEQLGGKCAQCCSTNKLEFDHIDIRTKEFTISDSLGISEKRLQAELAKCQLLCDPCHQTKTSKEWLGSL
jgi:5-methylcytosine-specific restriction endonuclease McrA